MQAYRALILRGNRFLGSTLVDKKFVSVGQLEEANERFMELIQADEGGVCSILNILINEMKCLNESVLLEHYFEHSKIGLIDLENYRTAAARDLNYDLDLARATCTVPFDVIEGFVCIATAYYLSAPIVKQWQEHFGNKVIWYAGSLQGIGTYLGRVRELEETLTIQEEEAKEEAEAEAKISETRSRGPAG